jgi:hypothetical protein
MHNGLRRRVFDQQWRNGVMQSRETPRMQISVRNVERGSNALARIEHVADHRHRAIADALKQLRRSIAPQRQHGGDFKPGIDGAFDPVQFARGLEPVEQAAHALIAVTSDGVRAGAHGGGRRK